MPGLGKAFVNKKIKISRRERLRDNFNKCVGSKYKTGIQHNFYVFRFPAADVQINSCQPDPTTPPLSTASRDLTAYSASDVTENTTAVSAEAVTEAGQFLRKRFRVVCVTETLSPTEGPSTTTAVPEEHSPTDSPKLTPHLAFKNDAVVFGGKGLMW